MTKNNSRILLLVIAAVLVGLIICGGNSAYRNSNGNGRGKGRGKGRVRGNNVDDDTQQYAPADLKGTDIDLNLSCAMESGTGLASSLLPREVASQEDFGQFSPDEILKGQNFLNPRQQIGFPETIGGVLRNGNQQVRADPPNPKQPYTWNNSTIVPDLMQRKICT